VSAEEHEIRPNAIYGLEEAASLLHLHPKTMADRCRSGQIRSYREGRGLRIRGQWLLDYVEERAGPKPGSPTTIASSTAPAPGQPNWADQASATDREQPGPPP
jgi:excisionase family DNA binding protein